MFWLFGLGDPWVKTGLTEKPNFDTSFHFGKNGPFEDLYDYRSKVNIWQNKFLVDEC